MTELQVSLSAYWQWLATQPQWQGCSPAEIKAQYVDLYHDDPEYEELTSIVQHGVAQTIAQANRLGYLPSLLREQLLEAVLIDYLWEDVLSNCTQELQPLPREQFLRGGSAHWSYHVRYLCLEKIGTYPFVGAAALLAQTIENDPTEVVRRYALLSLALLDKAQAIHFALINLQNDQAEEYTLLASAEIVADYDKQLLAPYCASLKAKSGVHLQQKLAALCS